MIEMSPDITKLTAALAKAQAELGGAKKDASNPHFKSKYATLEAVIEAIKPIHKHGLTVTQFPGSIVDGSIEITSILGHESGQWMRSTMHVPLGKRDAQGVGSAVSYGRRYSLMAICGIPAEDDDGNAASARHEPIRRPPSPPPPPAPRDDNQDLYDSFQRALADCGDVETMRLCAEEFGVTTADPVIAAMVKAKMRELNGSHR